MFQKIELQIQKTIDYYKQQGLLQFLKRFFGKLGFEHFSRSLIFLVLDLKDIPDDVEKPYSFHIAAVNDIENDRNFDCGFFAKRQAIYRLQKGHRLFVLKEGTRLVYFQWVEQKNASIWWFDYLPIDLPKNMAYMAAAYTVPEFRNKGIATKLKAEIYYFLKKEGINYLISAIHPKNTINLNIHKKLGFREYQTIQYKRYWHIRYYTVKKANSNESKTFISLFKFPKDIWEIFL